MPSLTEQNNDQDVLSLEWRVLRRPDTRQTLEITNVSDMLRWCFFFFYPTNLIFSTLLLEYPLFKWVICISSDWRSSMISILSSWSEWMPGQPGPSIEQCDCQSLHQEHKAGHHWLAEGHFRDELLPEDSSLCLNVLSARLNNLNICFYLVGKERGSSFSFLKS